MESRLSCQKDVDFMRPPTIPYFEGHGTEGKTLLIWSEQGIGEQLMTASMYAEVLERTKKVILEVDDRLVDMMRRSFPDMEVYSSWNGDARIEAYARADYQIPALNLCRFLRRGFEDFPDRAVPYLDVRDDHANALREKYEAMANGRPIIGIAWKSLAKDGRGALKSIPLDHLQEIWKQDAFFVSLQYSSDISDGVYRTPIFLDESINHYVNYDMTAAQVAAMDAVVTVSNTVLHTAGCLNVPTMAIIPGGRVRHWYWFLRRTDCPWYPTVNLFRPEPDTDGDTWYATSVKRIAARINSIIEAAKQE